MLVALLEEVDKAIPMEAFLDWIGCTEVPDQIIESIQPLIKYIDVIWIPPPETEIMNAIAHMNKLAGMVRTMTERLRGKDNVTTEDLRRIIDGLYDIKDDVHKEIGLMEHI